jgi:hypothetical protein
VCSNYTDGGPDRGLEGGEISGARSSDALITCVHRSPALLKSLLVVKDVITSNIRGRHYFGWLGRPEIGSERG